jgi:hypothetical protein
MLTALLILLLLLHGVLVVLLFLPFRLLIHSAHDVYLVQWGPLHAGLYFAEGHVRYRVHLPFWTKEGGFSELLEPHGRKPRPARPHQRRATRWRPPILTLLRTFRVQHFRWVLDTGDPLWNAWLYPLFHLIRQRGHAVSISFTGRNEVELIMSNNLYRVLKAVLLHRPTKTNDHEQGHE